MYLLRQRRLSVVKDPFINICLKMIPARSFSHVGLEVDVEVDEHIWHNGNRNLLIHRHNHSTASEFAPQSNSALDNASVAGPNRELAASNPGRCWTSPGFRFVCGTARRR